MMWTTLLPIIALVVLCVLIDRLLFAPYRRARRQARAIVEEVKRAEQKTPREPSSSKGRY
jgi:hypothetical protein